MTYIDILHQLRERIASDPNISDVDKMEYTSQIDTAIMAANTTERQLRICTSTLQLITAAPSRTEDDEFCIKLATIGLDLCNKGG